MGLLNYSRTLVAKTAENVNDIQTMFNEVRAILNGNVDESNVTASILAAQLKTGMITWTAAASPDVGHLFCDGTPQDKNQYAALYARLGGASSPYGQAATTFNLPNLTDRSPMGAGSTVALGANAGAATVTLSVAQMPAHNHPITLRGVQGPGSPSFAQYTVNTQVVSTLYDPDNASVGGGQPHSNVHPVLGLRAQIKY